MSEYKGYNEISKRATMKYLKEQRETLGLNLPKGTKSEWKEKAEKRGMSLTSYISWLIENDNGGEE